MTIVRNCPFCDEDQVEIGEPELGEYAVDCPTCRCIGPYASSIESAIQPWNAPHDRDFKIDRLVREAREGFNVRRNPPPEPRSGGGNPQAQLAGGRVDGGVGGNAAPPAPTFVEDEG